MRRLLATLVFTSLTACSGIGGDLGSQIDGTWNGNSNGQGVKLQLVQSGNVLGVATITSTTSGSHTYSVSGMYTSPNFTATLTGSAPADTIALVATVSGKSMVGTLSGSGFTGNGLAMLRE